MMSEKRKIIYLLCSIFFLFLIEQFMLSIIIQPLKKITLLIYPSMFFWIAIAIGLWFRTKYILESRLLVKMASIAVIIFWAISLSLIPVYLPVTAFMAENSSIDFFKTLHLISISLHRAGWTLILLILFWSMMPTATE